MIQRYSLEPDDEGDLVRWSDVESMQAVVEAALLWDRRQDDPDASEWHSTVDLRNEVARFLRPPANPA